MIGRYVGPAPENDWNSMNSPRHRVDRRTVREIESIFVGYRDPWFLRLLSWISRTRHRVHVWRTHTLLGRWIDDLAFMATGLLIAGVLGYGVFSWVTGRG